MISPLRFGRIRSNIFVRLAHSWLINGRRLGHLRICRIRKTLFFIVALLSFSFQFQFVWMQCAETRLSIIFYLNIWVFVKCIAFSTVHCYEMYTRVLLAINKRAIRRCLESETNSQSKCAEWYRRINVFVCRRDKNTNTNDSHLPVSN